MKTRPFKQVDVFTREPFMGNPVAVVIGAEELTAEAMQRRAAWTNLSETTFILPSERADDRLRIFTPKRELGFAGHPVIGSAHAALESGYAAARAGVIRQECAAGIFDLAVGREYGRPAHFRARARSENQRLRRGGCARSRAARKNFPFPAPHRDRPLMDRGRSRHRR